MILVGSSGIHFFGVAKVFIAFFYFHHFVNWIQQCSSTLKFISKVENGFLGSFTFQRTDQNLIHNFYLSMTIVEHSLNVRTEFLIFNGFVYR